MAILGKLSTVRAQLTPAPVVAAALDYLQRCLTKESEESRRIHTIPAGTTERIELPHGAFAMEQVYKTKPHSAGRWEAHIQYIDIQMIVDGQERMEWADIGDLTLAEDLTPAQDVRFFAAFNEGNIFHAKAGTAAVFFPVDAHRPSLQPAEGTATLVRKTVVKIPVSAIA